MAAAESDDAVGAGSKRGSLSALSHVRDAFDSRPTGLGEAWLAVTVQAMPTTRHTSRPSTLNRDLELTSAAYRSQVAELDALTAEDFALVYWPQLGAVTAIVRPTPASFPSAKEAD